MNIERIASICRENGRRTLIVSSGDAVLLAALDMEGRFFFSHAGKTVSLFREEAAKNISSSSSGYFNPGGDTLWPAPEGTCFGYCYASGSWMVPSAVAHAQYEIISCKSDSFEIAADIQLVNNQQLGIPCRFIRKAEIRKLTDGSTEIVQFDGIEYTGTRGLKRDEFMLAPWSLSQFNVSSGARAYFGDPGHPVRDLYAPGEHLRSVENGIVTMRPDRANRVQVALPEKSGFVRLYLPEKQLEITRRAGDFDPATETADIADAPIDIRPLNDVRYSVYNDPSGFMELEVVGNCQYDLLPGTCLGMNIRNIITTKEN